MVLSSIYFIRLYDLLRVLNELRSSKQIIPDQCFTIRFSLATDNQRISLQRQQFVFGWHLPTAVTASWNVSWQLAIIFSKLHRLYSQNF